jgi:hypothetical protein
MSAKTGKCATKPDHEKVISAVKMQGMSEKLEKISAVVSKVRII